MHLHLYFLHNPVVLQGVYTRIMYSYIPVDKLNTHCKATNLETDFFAPHDANSSIEMIKAPKAWALHQSNFSPTRQVSIRNQQEDKHLVDVRWEDLITHIVLSKESPGLLRNGLWSDFVYLLWIDIPGLCVALGYNYRNSSTSIGTS